MSLPAGVRGGSGGTAELPARSLSVRGVLGASLTGFGRKRHLGCSL